MDSLYVENLLPKSPDRFHTSSLAWQMDEMGEKHQIFLHLTSISAALAKNYVSLD
jgi:hypothetical protein